MKVFKKITSLLSWGVTAFLLFVAALLILSKMNTPVGLRVFSVLSGSMEPEIHVGSMVFVKSQADYAEGDVVTVRAKTGEETVTHRIHKVIKNDEEGVVLYELKGDANEEPDREQVNKNRVVGKVITSIPYVGRIVAFSQTQMGFMLLIVIPAVLIIYSEAMSIKKEVLKLLKNKKQKNSSKETTMAEKHIEESE